MDMTKELDAKRRPYLALKTHYETCFETHGDTHKGMDWPNAEDAIKRFDVMLGLVRREDQRAADILDIGCGSAHLLEHLLANETKFSRYRGIDISPLMIGQAEKKHPEFDFQCLDLLEFDLGKLIATIEPADYVIMNGLFTEKREMTQDEMDAFFSAMLRRAHALCRKGLAFNVMSMHVNWMRDDLYHLPYDRMAEILMGIVGRNHMIRADYGLYEYTVYAYR